MDRVLSASGHRSRVKRSGLDGSTQLKLMPYYSPAGEARGD